MPAPLSSPTTPFKAEAIQSSPPSAASVRSTSRKIRVLIVDDSVVIRRFLSRILNEDGGFEVVGFAANGSLALARAAELKPDAITMDIEMPEMDGLTTVRRLRQLASTAVIIMCSTLTSRGASATIESLIHGANDYVTKPSHGDSIDSALESLRLELIPKIKQFFESSGFPPANGSRHGAQRLPASFVRPAGVTLPHYPAAIPVERRRIVAIGVSTGGPTALMRVLPDLPATFPLPIVIVQHMPPIFTRQLADRLRAQSKLEVLEATEGMLLAAGRVILAPGDYHMRLQRNGIDVRVTLDQGDRENSCRPAVDVLFRSVATIFGGDALAVILTGMGQDGLRGVEQLKDKGAYIIAQDRTSSVVWGMPGAVADAGLANAVLTLDEIASAILRQVPSK